MEVYKETNLKMAREGFDALVSDLEGFIDSRGLTSFGAGISGIGLNSRDLALKVLGFIYEQNCKEDFNALIEGMNG